MINRIVLNISIFDFKDTMFTQTHLLLAKTIVSNIF